MVFGEEADVSGEVEEEGESDVGRVSGLADEGSVAPEESGGVLPDGGSVGSSGLSRIVIID
jgi:hypothetical protein